MPQTLPVSVVVLMQKTAQDSNLYSTFYISTYTCFTLLTGQRPPRYLTVDGTTGLADRLVADVSGLAVAIIMRHAFLLTEHLGATKVLAYSGMPCG